MFRLVIFLPILMLISCSTPPPPMTATTHLLSTNRAPADLLPELKADFEKNKYKVRAENPKVGVLTLQPRSFSVEGLAAQQVVQMRQEGGSLKLKISYLCRNEVGKMAPCNTANEQLNEKTRRLNQMVVRLIDKHLMQDRAKKPEATSLGEIIPEEPQGKP